MSFWQTKSLSELSTAEWESLCDGCGKCCLHKLEDEDTGEIFYTDVACRLLDLDSCQCRGYEDRFAQVPDCFKLTPDNLHLQTWLPASCAYRRLFEGKTLPHWHPLVSKNDQSVHISGNSVHGRAITEQSVQPDEMEERIVLWVN